MSLDQVKKKSALNTYQDSPAKIYNEDRPYGDTSIRSQGDVFGKMLYDDLETAPEKKRGRRLREKYLPDIPGFKAEKLTNRYAQDVYLDKLTELAVDANLIQDRYPLAIVCGAFGAVVDWGKELVSGNTYNPIKLVGSLGTKILDNMAAAKKESLHLSQLYNRKSLEYLHLVNTIMQDERRDWQLYRISEMDRAYFSHNRLEWFFVGSALTGLHQAVGFSVMEMDKAMLESNKKLEGSQMREILNPGLGLLDSVLSNFKFNVNTKKKTP